MARPNLDQHDTSRMWALREDVLSSPVSVALHRARTYTRVFRETEGAPWIVRKGMALREHLETVPLYIRDGDLIAGSLTETPGAMPVNVELGIGENRIFVTEDPHRLGYLRGQVPQDIVDYWEDRNLWGRYREHRRAAEAAEFERTEVTQYKFLSCQGHLSPSYAELLDVGLGGVLQRVLARREGETDPAALQFLTAAEHCLRGVSAWAARYAELGRAGCVAARVASGPPETFHEALQLIWLVHQAVHVEGHGYSCTPDRIDQLLYPFYLADKEAGGLTDDEALTLCENLLLKMRDNTVWSVEHNLTQGVCLAGSTPNGQDRTNELSWLFVRAADNMSMPEPLVWIRWHAGIDREFFDFCLATLAGSTCFPLMMSDAAVPAMLMELGVEREDAFNYVAAGCNELAVSGQAYFNPCAHAGYLNALEQAMTQGQDDVHTFEDLVAAVAQCMRRQVEWSYRNGMVELSMQMAWGQTPLTSCFFDGCIDRARDMIEGTKYNILSCGGIGFANMVDCLAAIREVVYEKGEATLETVAAACAADFEGHGALRAKLLAAPKHGNDDPRLAEIIRLVERMRDEPVKEICRDPRDGTPFGNSHVVRSGAVTQGRVTGATPDGRLAGTPLAASVAASAGCETSGPTAVLNSVLQLDPVRSWQWGYNVNLRLSRPMLAEAGGRERVRAMLDSYFERGGQEVQINCVDTATLRAAQERPAEFRDLVVRVAGFSEFFTKLAPDIQADVIARTEHSQ